MSVTKLARAVAVSAAVACALMLSSDEPAAAQPFSEGYVLVDTWTSREPSSQVPRFARPQGMDVLEADDPAAGGRAGVYVVDGDARNLLLLDSSGAVVRRWAVDTAVPRPFDVAVTTQRILVVGRNTGQVWDHDGRVLRTLSLPGVSGAAAGPGGHFYIARHTGGSSGETQIVILSADGDVVETWSDDPLVIVTPRGLDVTSEGRVYLAGDGAVYVFEDGHITGGLRVPAAIESGTVLDVAADDEGRVFAVQGASSRRLVAWQGRTGDVVGSASLSGAQSIAVGPGSGLVVGSYINGGFAGVAYLPDRGELQAAPLRWGNAGESLGELVGPRRLATSPSGAVFVLDRRQSVQLWSSDGMPQQQWPIADFGHATDVVGGADRPCIVSSRTVACMARAQTTEWSAELSDEEWLVAADGTAEHIVAVDLAGQRVLVFDRLGRRTGSWPLAAHASFTAATDVGIDGGLVYIASRAEHRILVRTLGGQVAGPGAIEVPGEVMRVEARDGRVYALTNEGWIWKFDNGGRPLTVWRPSPERQPTDLAAGANGRVYVSVSGGTLEPPQAQGAILVFEPHGSPPTAAPPLADRTCVVSVDKMASPASVTVGEPVQIVLTVDGTCPYGDGRLDVALLIDKSGSMAGSPLAAAQAAAITFLGQLDPAGAQVAVIGFSTSATVLQTLTNDMRAVVRAVGRIEAGGQTNYRDALEKALVELTSSRARPEVPSVVVLMTDGKPTDRNLVLRASEDLKSIGAIVYTIGLGPKVDADLLRSVATEPDLYFEAPTESELADVYTLIARRITASRLLRAGTITDELPADMALVADSTTPSAVVSGRTLTWSLADVTTTGAVLRYSVRPRRPGLRPTNVRAVLEYEDATGHRDEAVFPIPRVEVLQRTSWSAHLPVVWKNRCKPQRADVVLVFDTSSSMTAPARPGVAVTKLEAAVSAGRTFLGAMQLPGDQAAIVTFDGSARRLQKLTGSRAALELALDQVSAGRGTRIDRGIEQAIVELLSARHEERNNPVMIVLTDGLPEPGTEGRALRSALDARAAGIILFTIGLGSDADPDLLWLLSGSDERTFMAPDASQLDGIYKQIAGKVLCD